MGLRSDEDLKSHGLASLLFDSPRQDTRLTALDAQRLANDLQAAVHYVFHGSGGGLAAAEQAAPPLVANGHIDYEAVSQHVQHAVRVAGDLQVAGVEPEPQAAAQRVPGAAELPTAEAAQHSREQQQSNEPTSGMTAGGSGNALHSDQPPDLESEPSAESPRAANQAATAPAAMQPGRSASSGAGGARSSIGRLGPADVALVEARGNCEINGTHAMSLTNFATVRSNACVFKGRWQYEVQLGSAGIMQLGWTTLAARFNSEEGVGDNTDSYAYDGRRRMRWHASNHPYGEHWSAGDVIGCCIDLDAGTMRFYRNGRDLGEAFANVRRAMPGMAYFAGVSLSYAERCEINFGARPFVHPVEGYEPLEQQPEGQEQQPVAATASGLGGEAASAAPRTQRQQLAAARYLAGCLSRLLDVSSGAAEQELADQAAAAAQLAAEAERASEGSSVAGDAAGEEQPVSVAAAGEPALLFPASAGGLPISGSRLPDTDILAALAAAAGDPGSSKQGVAAGRALDVQRLSGHPHGPAIQIDDRVLLGAVLAQHFGPLCFDPYLVEAVLVPLLDDTAGELGGGRSSDSSEEAVRNSEGAGAAAAGTTAAESAEECTTGAEETAGGTAEERAAAATAAASCAAAGGDGPGVGAGEGGQDEHGRQRLAQLLDLLAAVLEPEEIAALATTTCQVLGRRVRGCVLSLGQLPGSDALSALRLWGAVIDCAAFREAWLASGDWLLQLEQLMSVRQPSEDDLKELFRNLKVVWGEGGSAVVRNRREDQSAFSADLNRVTGGLEQIEAAQADLLLRLWLEPGGGEAAAGCMSQEAPEQEAGAAVSGALALVNEAEGQQQQQQAEEGEAEAGPEAGADTVAEEQRDAEVAANDDTAPDAGAEAEAEAGPQAEDQQGGDRQVAEERQHGSEGEAEEQRQAEGEAQQQEGETPSAAKQAQQAQQAQHGGYLRQFLQHLVDKNHGAMRHIPPPGLSDQTALVSTVFALLRLMNEQVSASLPDVPMLRWDPAATFLHGGALGGGDDPYWDAGRVGGTLSHLAREHPPAGEDKLPLSPLPVSAMVKYDATLRLAAHAKEAPSFADVWLRDRLLVLCHLAAAPLMRGSLSHLASMQAAMAGLRAVSGDGSGRMVDQTRRQCQQEFVRSLRAYEWSQCWLLSPAHQHSAFVLAVGTAQLLEAVSQERPALLRYVPELYITTGLDIVSAIHRCEPAVLEHSAMLSLGLRHIIKFVVRHLEDERIVSPEVQSRLLHMVLDGVQELDLLRELGSNPVSRARLVPAMMRLFGRPQLWGPVSNFFALLVEGTGFLHPLPPFPEEFEEPLGALRQLFLEACRADADLCARFTHHLFDNANRMLTELVASLENMESSWTRGAGPSPQLLRLLTSTADYALVLLRVAELMAARMPQLFLEGSDMNLTRLAEVLGFAVPQFVSGRAHRALQRVAAERLAAQLRLREAHLLQPLAGALVALWQAEQQQREEAAHEELHVQAVQQAEDRGLGAEADEAPAAPEPAAGAAQAPAEAALAARRPRRQSLVKALDRQAALTDDVLRALLDTELSQVEPLSAEAAAAAAEVAASGEPSAQQQRVEREAQLQLLELAISGIIEQRAAAAEAAAAAASARAGDGSGGGAGAGGGGQHAEPPEEFLDPILMTVMQDPVVLPDSRVCLDRATIERHLLSSATDPFSRAPLSKEQLIPDDQLRARIDAWLQEHGSAHGQ